MGSKQTWSQKTEKLDGCVAQSTALDPGTEEDEGLPNIQGPALVPSTSQTRCRLEGGCRRSGTQGFPWLHSHFGENMEDVRSCLPPTLKKESL